MKITENVYMLEVKAGERYYYPVVLRDLDNTVLVDTGLSGQYGSLKEALDSEGISVDAITCVIFTHQDADHTGGAKEVLLHAKSAKTMAHEFETPYIDGSLIPIKLTRLEKDNPRYIQAITGLEERRVLIDEKLSDGDVLPLCGGVDVILAPGHTPGHICLYVRKDKILICGDALNITEGRLTGANPVHTYDMALADESAKRLAEYDTSAVLTYHGGMYKGQSRDVLESVG